MRQFEWDGWVGGLRHMEKGETLLTLAKGARQFVVQEALDTTGRSAL